MDAQLLWWLLLAVWRFFRWDKASCVGNHSRVAQRNVDTSLRWYSKLLHSPLQGRCSDCRHRVLPSKDGSALLYLAHRLGPRARIPYYNLCYADFPRVLGFSAASIVDWKREIQELGVYTRATLPEKICFPDMPSSSICRKGLEI
jgi:hypothetical protein